MNPLPLLGGAFVVFGFVMVARSWIDARRFTMDPEGSGRILCTGTSKAFGFRGNVPHYVLALRGDTAELTNFLSRGSMSVELPKSELDFVFSGSTLVKIRHAPSKTSLIPRMFGPHAESEIEPESPAGQCRLHRGPVNGELVDRGAVVARTWR